MPMAITLMVLSFEVFQVFERDDSMGQVRRTSMTELQLGKTI